MGLPLSADNILQRSVIEHGLNEQTFEFAVLAFERLEVLRIRDRHAAEFGLPVVISCIADTVLAAEVGDLSTGFCFLQDPNDLLFCESVLHAYLPLKQVLY